MDGFPGESAWLVLSCVNMPVLCAFAPVEIFMISSLNVHISEVLNKEKKTKKKKLGKSNIALMMQNEQCITEAAWILKVILHSAANNS